MVLSILLNEALETLPARRTGLDGELELPAVSRVVLNNMFHLASP